MSVISSSRWIGAFAWALACGARSEIAAPVIADAGTTTNAVLLAECGPADGAAFAVVIDPGATCTTPPIAGFGIELSFYFAPVPESAGSYKIGGGVASGSRGTVCEASTCVDALAGTLEITNVEGKGTSITTESGTYTLTMPNGTTRTGSFVATNCHNAPLCG